MTRLLLNWKKTQTRNSAVLSCYIETKQLFEIPICFWFQWMSLRMSLLYLRCGCITFDFTTQKIYCNDSLFIFL